MPTLIFLLYLLAVGGAYLLRLSYLGWFGPYFLLSVIVMPLALLFLCLPAMLTLKAKASVPQTIAKGRDATLTLRFDGPRFLLPCRVIVSGEIENTFAGEIWRFRESVADPLSEGLEIPLSTALCGQLRCRVTRVECRDLLGLIRIRRAVPQDLSCTVLPPAVAPKSAPDLDAALDTAPILRPKYGGGYSEEHDLREYRPGDTVNSIHWKLSSKTDEVIVREPLISANQDIYLILGRIGKEDRGLELLYWLSLELCARELPHTFVADTLYDVGNEAEGVEALCTILAKPMDKPCPFDPAGARCVFLITDGEVAVK